MDKPISRPKGGADHIALPRIATLDGLRGCASAMVLLYHLFDQPLQFNPGSAGAYLKRALSLGWMGVDLFFVLSGFLIAGILLDSRELPHYFRRFYIRRICRIFPLYYLLLALYSICVVFSGSTWHGFISPHPGLAWYWFFVQNFGFAMAAARGEPWFWMGGVWMAASWSLAIEEQFYIVLPAFIRSIRSLRTISISAGIIMAAALAVRFAVYAWSPSEQDVNYVLLFSRVDALSAGVLLACCYRTRYWALARSFCPFVLPLGAIAILILVGRRMELEPISYTVYSLFFAAMLVSAIEAKGIWMKLLSSKTMVYLGTISYGTYLLHPILLRLVFLWADGSEPVITKLTDVIPSSFALVLTMLLAPLSFSFFESPFQRIGKGLT